MSNLSNIMFYITGWLPGFIRSFVNGLVFVLAGSAFLGAIGRFIQFIRGR